MPRSRILFEGEIKLKRWHSVGITFDSADAATHVRAFEAQEESAAPKHKQTQI